MDFHEKHFIIKFNKQIIKSHYIGNHEFQVCPQNMGIKRHIIFEPNENPTKIPFWILQFAALRLIYYLCDLS